MYKRSTNVEHEMYEYTGNNYSYRNSKTRFKEKLESHTGKTSVDLLRNIAVFGTCYKIRKVLQYET
jgi:hypothetical protein